MTTELSEELKQSLLNNPYLGSKGKAMVEDYTMKVLSARDIDCLAFNIDNIAN